MSDKTPKVTGIGGIFFRSKNPKEIKEWYGENLGLAITPHGLVKKLRENGVTIVDEIVEYEYGKFVHIMDPEGNKIELWEPIDSVFTKMGGPTTK